MKPSLIPWIRISPVIVWILAWLKKRPILWICKLQEEMSPFQPCSFFFFVCSECFIATTGLKPEKVIHKTPQHFIRKSRNDCTIKKFTVKECYNTFYKNRLEKITFHSRFHQLTIIGKPFSQFYGRYIKQLPLINTRMTVCLLVLSMFT